MARLSLSLLGPFQAALHDEPIAAFGSNKVRALLAYLAVEAGRPHSREKLAGLLWPERPARDANANLRYALSNLRSAIGDRAASPLLLFVTRQAVQFNRASDVWVDVTAFTELLASPAASLSDLERAVDLYRGEFLEGFFVGDSVAFEEWTLLKREQLGRQVRSALHRLATMCEQRGEYGRALPHAWRQVELDPWQDEAQQQLMRLLALSERRAAALVQYAVFRRALAEELGVEPARATTALYEQIRDGEELDESGDRQPAGEAAVVPVTVPLPAARWRLPRRVRLIVAGGGLTSLVVVAAILLLVAGNMRFGKGADATSTLLPAAGRPTEGKLVSVCEELPHSDDSASPPRICVTDYRAGQRIQITDDLAFEAISGLAWSPDGQQIVLSASPPGRTSRLYIIDVDGSGLRQLAGGEIPVIGPAWSPDGQWIVFTRRDDLWLVHPDGSQPHALLAASGFHLSRAAWSPDSQWIAFLRTPTRVGSMHEEVWVVDWDGIAPRQIYAFERAEDVGVFLGWSPDGRHVGCFLLRPDGATTLLVDAGGGGEIQEMEEMFGSWLPEYWPQWGEMK